MIRVQYDEGLYVDWTKEEFARLEEVRERKFKNFHVRRKTNAVWWVPPVSYSRVKGEEARQYARLVAIGASVENIADLFGRERSTIYYNLKKMGVPAPKPQGRIPEEVKKEIRRRHLAGETTLPKMVQEYGISRGGIAKVVKGLKKGRKRGGKG